MDEKVVLEEFQNLNDCDDVLKRIKEEEPDDTDFISEDLHHSIDIKEEKPFLEPQANEECKVQNLRNHVSEVHEKPLACEVCDYKTHYKGSLDMHIIRSHSAEKPFACEICKISFSYKPDFKQHMKVHHTQEFGKMKTYIKKQCACGTCDHSIDTKEEKLFLEPQANEECKVQITQPTGSVVNKINVAKQRRCKKAFVCEICDLNCLTKIWLERHLKSHIGERPFMCEICDFKSTHEKLLKEHILRDHSSEKPFACKICNFKFAMKADLRSHVLKVHEKPLACEVCDYKTHYKGVLDMHIIRSHSAEKPFTCEICKISFSYKPDFKQHMKVHHTHKFGKVRSHIKKQCACGTCDHKGHVALS